ncbi:hypothetical protein BD414DRAFT_436735 [Trametes punicea]|nr:hypothetical protein BD414DRAFT_436735 [Trametes punicea]
MSVRHSFLSTAGLVRPPSLVYLQEGTASPEHTKHIKHSAAGQDGRSSRATPRSGPVPTTGRAKAGIIPLSSAFIVGLAVLLSLLFIVSLSCAFISDEDERLAFASLLDDAAGNTPGIILIGNDVDVDIDEPALTIRWSIIACGQALVLPGSEGTHGSANCGLPAMSVAVHVDGGIEPAATYNPMLFPYVNGTGQRNSVHNMFQFDDDHVLDVREARLYPFDTYLLTSSLRAISTADNRSLPIQSLVTIKTTSSFVIAADDAYSFVGNSTGEEEPSRDLTLRVNRPAEARLYALLLFSASWMLAHATVALVVFSWHSNGAEKSLKTLACVFLIGLLIPQLRNAMPDAPGFDGEFVCSYPRFVDAIGFFPQMLMSAASALMLIAIMIQKDLQAVQNGPSEETRRPTDNGEGASFRLKMRRGGASADISHIRDLSGGK